MAESRTVFRVVVASPGDVQAERDALTGIIDELNRGLATDRGLVLELARWETDAYPGFHLDGPQGLIDEVLRVDDCDVLLGIFWKRFGTPTKDAQSGAAHEFQTAYETWKKQNRPQIMVYFNERAAAPKKVEEIDQWRRVLEFKEGFPREGLWWPYKTKAQFEKLARNHLSLVVRQRSEKTPRERQTTRKSRGGSGARQRGSERSSIEKKTVSAGKGGVAVGGDVHGDVHVHTTSGPKRGDALKNSYLTWVMEEVRNVPLAGVDPKSISEATRRDIDLAAVYTALMTLRAEGRPERELGREREPGQLSALNVLNREDHLALLGDPGSGKSSFVNFVALCMAGEMLGRPEANLALLRSPLPEDGAGGPDREAPEPQPWDHGPLLPIRVVLREFVARGLASAKRRVDADGDTLWRFIVGELPEPLRDFAEPLRDELMNSGGLLLLDGLDEVPEADERREQVKAAIERFLGVFQRVRVLVTSRVYAYQRQDWKLEGFAEVILAPFAGPQMRNFVDRWYGYVGPVRGLASDEVQGRAMALKEALERNERLYELATRPLLLTLMASLHSWRGGTLPGQREELYADSVDLLLDQWETQKLRRRPDGKYVMIEPSLAEWLKVDQKAIRQVLNRLAFEAHRDQAGLLFSTADITEEKLVGALLQVTRNPDARPARLVEYLRDRAGLLEPRGVGVYAFPHRTFQEYLAACHLTDHGFDDALPGLLRAEPSRWREVTLLAGAKAARGAAFASWRLAEALCPKDPSRRKTKDKSGFWGALLAAQVLIENGNVDHVVERDQPKVDKIRAWLGRTLADNALPAVDRAQAGDALARIGDLRFRPDAWYLPGEPLLGFVKIPAGEFRMGSDPKRDPDSFEDERDEHPVTLRDYYMARYPVTVAQFRAFVEHSGYRVADDDCLRGVSNHPVVRVSWYDALAYCDWLTDRLRGWKGAPKALSALLKENGRVTLPSEAEWEKAARGTDGRRYSWGDDPDPDRANYDDTGIGGTSAVGCFRNGRSPYEVEEMSGNVWEWTRSLWGEEFMEPRFTYSYDPNDQAREDLEASEDVCRVLRGGACFDSRRGVRCACRSGDGPRDTFSSVGFRVVLRFLP